MTLVYVLLCVLYVFIENGKKHLMFKSQMISCMKFYRIIFCADLDRMSHYVFFVSEIVAPQ